MKKIIHICPLDRNTGDNALNKAIRTMLKPAFHIEHMELVGNSFDRSCFDKLNTADAVIFGGGGVIHSCSGGSSRKNREQTGTMWNMDLSWISELRSKIILYSVGFNRFQGEPAPLTRMGEFFDVLADKNALVSFRNDLSRKRFLEYFPRFGGVGEMPDPGLFCRGNLREGGQQYALLQIACDRLEYRYPNGLDDFINLINEMREISPVPIYLIPHTTADGRVYGKLLSHLNVDNALGDLTRYAKVDSAMDLYRNALYTISTRGHSQICSIGNGTPTFAMSTHPKARGFMEDIGQIDACFDYLNDDRDTCIKQFRSFIDRLPKIREELIDVNRSFDKRIDAFNQDIFRFVYEGWVPPPLISDPDAVPSQEAVRLEYARDQKPSEPPREIETNHNAAYLPGRRTKVGVGTYVNGKPLAVPEALEPVCDNHPLRSFKRKQQSSDGATCGVVISCDANYYVGVTTCLRSLRRYNPRLPVTFLDAGLRQDQVEQVRKLVDSYARIEPLGTLDVSTFPSHLSKAALSSLYVNLASYDKVLYLDVDALVMGDLSPMFEALTRETDLVGVRGAYFNSLASGVQHTVDKEIENDGIPLLQADFPSLDLKNPGINSGCFVVWSSVAEAWQQSAEELMPYMRYFRTADQALLNVMISVRGLRLKLFNPLYNCMGFQLSKRTRHQVQELTTRIELDPSSCQLFLNGQRVVVCHFAGRHKPWNTSVNLPPSYAWDWHAAETDEQRTAVCSRYRLLQSASDKEFDSAVRQEVRKTGTPFQFYLNSAEMMREAGRVDKAYDLYGQARKLRLKSFAAAKNRILLGPENGMLHAAVEDFRADQRFYDNSDKRLKRFSDLAIEAYEGRFSPQMQGLLSRDYNHLRIRGFARLQKPALISNLLSDLPGERQLLPEIFLLGGLAASGVPETATANLLAYCDNNPKLMRRASNAAFRSAQRRLAAFKQMAPLADWPESGDIAQLGAGFGHFLRGLGHVTGRRIHAIDTGLDPLPEAEGITVAAFENYKKSLAMIVVANCLDRVSQRKAVLSGLSSTLVAGGYLMVIDAVNSVEGLDCFEGFGPLPASSKLLSIAEMQAKTGLVVVRSWLLDGERIVLLRKASVGPKASRSAATRAIATLSGALLSAQRQAAEEETKNNVDKRLARIVFSLDKYLGDPLPSDSQDPRALHPAPRLEAISVEGGKHTSIPSYMHVAYWASRNAGDRLLCAETKRVFMDAFPNYLRRQVSLAAELEVNEPPLADNPAFLVLGGGGIFHSTSSANGVSEWSVSRDALENLHVPVVGFGIGLNEFRGTDFYASETFREFMLTLARKSIVLGFREHRSVELMRRLLPEQAGKFVYQPCASLLLRSHHTALQLDRSDPSRQERSHVAVNAAFDRSSLRFGRRMDQALERLDRMVQTLLGQGHRVTVFAHCPEDAYLHSILSSREEVGLRRMDGCETQEILSAYNDVDLAVGMRTHAQLIPFAMGIPILSVITHDKMIWALEDLGVPSWGVELFDTEFLAKIESLSRNLLSDRLNTRLFIKSKLIEKYQITHSNIMTIKASLKAE